MKQQPRNEKSKVTTTTAPTTKTNTQPDHKTMEASEKYPEQIPEAQGDMADRAEIETEQEIQAGIWRARENMAQIEAEKKNAKSN